MQVWNLFQRCVDFKHENLGLQFDDMDQTKTNIPKFSERSKTLQNFNQLKTHCTGVIVHSGLYPENRSVKFYLNNDQFEQGKPSKHKKNIESFDIVYCFIMCFRPFKKHFVFFKLGPFYLVVTNVFKSRFFSFEGFLRWLKVSVDNTRCFEETC